MPDITQLLNACQNGDPAAASELLPLVYDELRQLAAHRMRQESPGQTLSATALVHEAYLRLVGNQQDIEQPEWDGKGHFFSAAATAMRRILVERARAKNSKKRGGGVKRQEFHEAFTVAVEDPGELVALDSALKKLAEMDERLSRVVDLRYFAGLTIPEVAVALNVSARTADRLWSFARSWLFQELRPDDTKKE